MSIFCPIQGCHEPWDLDTLHDIVSERYGEWDPTTRKTVIRSTRPYDELFAEVRADFRTRGCAALGSRCNIAEGEGTDLRALASATLLDMCGDDLDGVDALLDEFDYLGMLDEPELCERHGRERCNAPECVGVMLSEVRDAELWGGTD